VDSTIGNRQVDLYYNVKKFLTVDENNQQVLVPHPVYRVRNVFIYPDFVPKDALEGGENYFNSLDTTEYLGYYFISPNKKSTLSYDLILQALYVKPGSGYNVTNTEQTHSHLLSLKTFRLINIYYNEVVNPGAYGRDNLLDCNIQLTMLSQQSFKIELEGTNSAGNLGGALNLIYQHKNLFHGAELFNLKLKGAYEALSQQYSKLRSSQEYGVETSLRFPKFLLPILEKEEFIKEFNPTTSLLGAYNYQDMPYYRRTMANATFGYNWNSGSYSSHIVNPIQLNLVNLLSIDSAFKARIERSSYLAYSYRDVMILGGNYSYIFNNQSIKKSKDFWFMRINAEASGNMLGVLGKLAGWEKTDGSYNVLGQPFAQYFRADIDLRYNVVYNDVSSIVYRAFAGAGIPYGNSRAIPFEKQYFGGGANGIRAWQVRTLGPGTYKPDSIGFLNQTADIKLEFNAEYRFKLFWILEGAVYLDAGNIWSFNRDDTRPGSQFNIKTFYKDIAIGTGTGFRFDLDFVMLRADLGIKLRDPWLSDGSKWIISGRPYDRNDFTIVLAIGYPF
jgi:outer membrane protein assembly factor BamA